MTLDRAPVAKGRCSAGLLGFWSVFRRLILRELWREKTRTAIAVLGIALGIAVMIAIRLANRSAVESFRAAVDATSGQATLVIRGTAGRFDETLLTDAAWLTEYGTVSPVVEAYARVVEPDQRPRPGRPERGEVLHVLGIDPLVDSPIRSYRLLRTSEEVREPTPRELLRLLVEPDAVVLTERFAARTGRGLGEPIELAFGSSRRTFHVRGLLSDEGPARALDGNFALMDIAAAQWAVGRLGLLDRVDLKLRADLSPDDVREEIAARLPAGLVVELPSARFERTDTMIDAFQFNLAALGGIALLVGLFLIYNTVSISVAARRQEIGILQALGAGRATVVAVFLAEAALIAAIGAAGGLILGGWLARAAVVATAQTVETFFIAETARASARQLAPGFIEALIACGLGVPLALLAAAAPAFRAASIRPLEIISPARQIAGGARPSKRPAAIAAALFLAAWLLTRLGPIAGRPVFGFLAQFLLMLAAAFLVPLVLWTACRGLRRIVPPWPRVWLPTQLAAANLLGAVNRVSISVAALAVSLAMMTAISIMVGSFRETVVVWLEGTLRADLFVRPVILSSSTGEARIDAATMQRIRRDPQVAATGWFTSMQAPYENGTIRLAAADLNTMLDQRIIQFKSPRGDAGTEAGRQAAVRGQVLVSESFSLRYGKLPGDEVRLPTPRGEQPVAVAAVYYDYAANQGTVLLDGDLWRQFFGDDPGKGPSSASIYLVPGADAETVRQRLAQETAEAGQDLYIATNANVRQEAMRIFESTFAVTYALELIAIVVAGLGAVSTLLTLIYERQREIALLALAGATKGQVRRMVVLEAALIGGVSQAIGLLLGLLLALVLIYVINVQSFGWTIQFALPWRFLIESTLLILAATVLAGLYPASRAANIRPLEVVREE